MENNKHEISKESVLNILIIPLIRKMKNKFPEYKEQIGIVNMIYDDRFNIELGNGITLKFVNGSWIYGKWYCSYGTGGCSFVIDNNDIRYIIMPSSATCPDCTDADIIRLRYFFFNIIARARSDEWVNRQTGRFAYANNTPTCQNKEENSMVIPDIKNVFFNEVKKATTVMFNDHTSVVVKCAENDTFDPEVGLAMAITKKMFGSRTKLQKVVDKWVANSAPKNEQLRKKATRKAEKEAAKIEHFKAQTESYME